MGRWPREAALGFEATVQSSKPHRPEGRRWVLAFGPGLVFFLASVGPQDLVSNTAAGSTYGYSLIWTLAIIVFARFVILEASARYVLVTGESLLAGYDRAGRWVAWLIFASIILKRHISNLYQILLIGSSVDLLLPLPTHRSAAIWALLFWGLGFALMYWGRYKMVETCGKPLLVVLGGSLAAVAILSRPDPLAVARGTLIPSIPAEHGPYSYALLLAALVGSGAGALSNLKYAAFVHEKGWRDLSFLKRQRVDLVLTVIGLFAMSALMQIAAAATLQPLGVQLKGPEDLAPMFSQVLGDAGRIVLGLGLWAAVFTTYLGSNTGNSLIAADIYYNSIRPRLQGDTSIPAAKGLSDRPAYRWCLIWFCASPLYVLLTDWKPIWLTLLAASLFVVILPLIVLVLMRLTNDSKLMGNQVNGWGTNAVMVFVIVVAIYLTYQNATAFWSDLRAAF